jgi:FtsZ-binding cell division protein ZapB
MKSPWIVLSAALALCALAAGWKWQQASNRVAVLQAQVAQLTTDNTKLNADVTEETQRSDELEEESAQLRAARAVTSGRLEPSFAPVSVPTPPPVEPPKPSEGLFTRMFKDPEMLKMLESQQATVLRALYADYLKEAGLSQDQTMRFFQVLQDRQMALMGASENAMSGGAVDMKAATAATNAASDALRELLGPDQFTLFEKYEKSLGPRVQVARLNQQLTGIGVPLRDYQATALIQIISQESAALPVFGNGGASAQSMDPAAIDDYAQAVEAANQRIYTRARSLLKPEQLAALAAFQKNMAATQVAGLKMARQMMGGE